MTKLESKVTLLGALLLWGFWAFLPKLAMQSLPPHSVLLYEGLGGFCAVIVFALSAAERRLPAPGKHGLSLAVCGSGLSMLGVLFYYYALKSGPVATVSTISAMYPLVSIALARAVLKEKMSPRQFAAVALGMVSIYLLAG